MTSINLGFVQFSPILNDLPATLDRLNQLIRQSLTEQAVDLLVLPELCNSGYNFESSEQAFQTAEATNESRFIDYLTQQCATYDMHIVSGFNERVGNSLYNSAVLVGPTGHLGTYRKLHLFLNEQDVFKPGDLGLPVFDIGLCKVGLLVCFDWVFPEVWRILALKKADIICHPSNLVLPGLCQSAVPTHALVNHVYVITANRIGTERELTFTGLSTIANPKGIVLAQAPPDSENVTIINIGLDLARDKAITPRNHLFTDRRVELYEELLRLR